jgi:hypothetical protein
VDYQSSFDTDTVSQAEVLGGTMSSPDLRHFNQVQLARRWSLSPRTLERWRWLRQGPEYLKVGGRVVYRAEDIETFEAAQKRPTRFLPPPHI